MRREIPFRDPRAICRDISLLRSALPSCAPPPPLGALLLPSLLFASAQRSLLLVSAGYLFSFLATVVACVSKSSHDRVFSTAVGIRFPNWLRQFFGMHIVGRLFGRFFFE
jgi:branched-subunit amino acid transport protein